MRPRRINPERAVDLTKRETFIVFGCAFSLHDPPEAGRHGGARRNRLILNDLCDVLSGALKSASSLADTG